MYGVLESCRGNVATRPVQSVTVGSVPVDLDGVSGDSSDLVAVFVRVLFFPGARQVCWRGRRIGSRCGRAGLLEWCVRAELSVVLEHAPRVASAMMHAAEMSACFMGASGDN